MNQGFFLDLSSRVAVKTTSQLSGPSSEWASEEGFVHFRWNDTIFYVCYIPPHSPTFNLEEFKNYLLRLELSITHQSFPIVIMGDLNSRSTTWGDKLSDTRGDILLEWFTANSLTTLNNSVSFTPTFRNHSGESAVDVVAVSSPSLPLFSQLTVLDNFENYSDHHAVEFRMCKSFPPPIIPPVSTGWWIPKIASPSFTTLVARTLTLILAATSFLTAQSCQAALTYSLNNSYAIKDPSLEKRKSSYWWTPEIASLRKSCLKQRRRLYKMKGKKCAENDQAYLDFTNSRKLLNDAIFKSKNSHWDNLIADLEFDCWGRAYKVMRNKFKSPKTHDNESLSELELRRVVSELFPIHPIISWQMSVIEEEIVPLSNDEVRRACSRLRPKKAPGPDRIPPEIIRSFVLSNIVPCTDMFNNYLLTGHFPIEWKEAILFLLPKSKKAGIKKYRPICLLNGLGKVFEHIILFRLTSLSDPLSERQFGFRHGRSTLDVINKLRDIYAGKHDVKGKKALAILTLDVKNAFNSLSWLDIIKSLEGKNAPAYLVNLIKSYLSDRVITYGAFSFPVSSGVPQGSILGPFLFNICYDSVIEKVHSVRCEKLGYADDLSVIFEASTIPELRAVSEVVSAEINEELGPKRLGLEPDKTEACLLGGGKRWSRASFRVLGCLIRPSLSIKYLGFWIDKNLSFKNHVIKACEKAKKVHCSLLPLLPNIRGPTFKKRKLILNAVFSSLFYGLPVWAEVTKIAKYRNIITKTCRPFKRCICAAYRTVSNNILDVLSGIPPSDLYIESRCRQYDGEPKSLIKSDIVEKWVTRLEGQTDSDVWFKSVIPDLRSFIHRPFGDTNFFLTQFFSGHGNFRDYLHRFKLTPDDLCPMPNCNSRDSPEHTFYHCSFFLSERSLLNASLGAVFTLASTQDLLLSSQDNWNHISSYIEKVLRLKSNQQPSLHPDQPPPPPPPHADGIPIGNSGWTISQQTT